LRADRGTADAEGHRQTEVVKATRKRKRSRRSRRQARPAAAAAAAAAALARKKRNLRAAARVTVRRILQCIKLRHLIR
jgi:hypothetical protein